MEIRGRIKHFKGGKDLKEFLDSYGQVVAPYNLKGKRIVLYDAHHVRIGKTLKKWESINIGQGKLKYLFCGINDALYAYDSSGTEYLLSGVTSDYNHCRLRLKKTSTVTDTSKVSITQIITRQDKNQREVKEENEYLQL